MEQKPWYFKHIYLSTVALYCHLLVLKLITNLSRRTPDFLYCNHNVYQFTHNTPQLLYILCIFVDCLYSVLYCINLVCIFVYCIVYILYYVYIGICILCAVYLFVFCIFLTSYLCTSCLVSVLFGVKDFHLSLHFLCFDRVTIKLI